MRLGRGPTKTIPIEAKEESADSLFITLPCFLS
jgi:hypothetical protein